MTDATHSLPFAEIADRLGVDSSVAGGRHRAPRSAGASRALAGVVAGAALSGGVALVAAPAASAQSVELPSPEQAFQMAQDYARSIGIPEDQVRQYAGMFPGFQLPGLSGAHAPTVPSEITSGFGPRWGGFHNGTDFGVPVGTPLYAAKSGVIEAAGPASGYGLWIRVRTDDGYLLEYGHNNANYVEVGQRVNAGQVIGEAGNRGWSTGPHLHFGVQDPSGNWIDPVPWLAANGVIV